MNRLNKESSLYLKQHADNPVHWWPWCEEAFETAKEEDKPVLVSIGYSSCHWCHVMAHECFEDDYIAGIMNRHFICVKVDREERPDVDHFYMEAVQMLNQQGGWPLNVFCLPDKRPFMGGTYFPPEDRGHGIIPWPHLLVRIHEAYEKQKDDLVGNADAITQNIQHISQQAGTEETPWNNQYLLQGARGITGQLDKEYGGFSSAPKFPPSQILGYLMAIRSAEACTVELEAAIDQSVQTTANAMIYSGLYDQLGGAFYRYSVDAEWRIPHFEKMLYDNALLIETLAKASTIYDVSAIPRVIEDTVTFLEQEFMNDTGLFAAAMDADSKDGEGAYYMWTQEAVEAVLGDDASVFSKDFQISAGKPSNPYPWKMTEEDFAGYQESLKLLKTARESRDKPVIDRKVLVGWNALLLKGLAVAGATEVSKRYLEMAKRGLDTLWDRARGESGSLKAVIYESEESQSPAGFIDDYAYFAYANLQYAAYAEWIETDSQEAYLNRAKELVEKLMNEFGAVDGMGFYFTGKNQTDLVVRKKEWLDNAYPSGNAVLVHVFSRLYAITGDAKYEKVLAKLRVAYSDKASRMPSGISYALEGFTWDAIGIAVLKIGAGIDVGDLLKAIAEKSWRPLHIERSAELGGQDFQLCVGQQCLLPTKDLAEIIDKL